jgi:Flp pilus assembly secretin CpaC
MIVVLAGLPAFADEGEPIQEAQTPLTSIVVARQQSKVIVTPYTIKSISVADSSICTVTRDEESLKHFVVIGTAFGMTHVTVWYTAPERPPEVVQVEVVTPSDQYQRLEAFLAAQFPQSQVSLIAVPTSSGVIVKGMAANSYEASRIFAILATSNITPPNLVNMLFIPCPHPPCCHRCRLHR